MNEKGNAKLSYSSRVKNNRQNYLIYLSIFFLFIGIRVIFLEQKNLWFDEIYSWNITLSSFKDIILQTAGDIHPPLYYFSLKSWLLIFGDSVIALRSMSVFYSVISFIFIYKICTKITDETNTILILLLYAVSPLHLYFSQEARMSMMNLTLNVISTYIFLRINEFIREKNESNRFIYYLTGYIVLTLYSLYTHYFSVFILTSHAVFLIIHYKTIDKHHIRQIVFAYILIFLAYIPWLPVFIEQVTKGQNWRSEQDVYSVLMSVLTFNHDIYYGFYYRFINFNIFRFLNVISVLITLSVIYLTIREYISKKFEWRFMLILLTCAIPLILGIIILFKQWVELFRYLSIIVPYIIIVIVYITFKMKLVIRYIIIFLVLTTHITGLYFYYSMPFKNNDYRDVMSYISVNKNEDEKLFVYPHYYGWIVNYYKTHGEYQLPENINFGWEKYSLINKINNKENAKFWLILDNQTQDSLINKDIIQAGEKNYRLADYKKFYKMSNTVELYRFELLRE